jgi:hypothetical protein
VTDTPDLKSYVEVCQVLDGKRYVSRVSKDDYFTDVDDLAQYLRQALLGAGYHPDTVKEFLP